MNFDEWLENYYSGTQIDETIAGMMQTAFEAGIAGPRDKQAQEWQPLPEPEYEE